MNDQEINIKIVSEVEKFPVLYNYKLPEYSRKDTTERAWSEVAKEVNKSVAECKERWKNIRAVFVRHMKPLKNGAGAKPKKPYYLFEAMQFTTPYIKTLGSPSGNLPTPPIQEDPDEAFEYSEEPEIPPSPPQLDTWQPLLVSSPPVPLPTKTIYLTQSQPSSVTKKKRSLKNDAVDKAFLEYLQEKKKKISSLHQPGHTTQDTKVEGLKMFLLSILPDLLKMSDEEVRKFKRMTIDTVDGILSTSSMMPQQLPHSS